VVIRQAAGEPRVRMGMVPLDVPVRRSGPKDALVTPLRRQTNRSKGTFVRRRGGCCCGGGGGDGGGGGGGSSLIASDGL
jgi:hypothetical protein